MTTPEKERARNVIILQITGLGWSETYEVLPDGTRNLLHSFSSRTEPHNFESATEATWIEEMLYEDFVEKYSSLGYKTHYPKPV